MKHRLDRPAWEALNHRQAKFALGSERAKRFLPSIGPLAGAVDESAASVAELLELLRSSRSLTLLQKDPIVVPDFVEVTRKAAGVQLILEDLRSVDKVASIQRLTQQDVPAMLELATLTKPGPFEKDTSQLGDFWGIKENDRLLAMAGERMKPEGFAEVSGVCVHPEARGRGYARELSAHVASLICARGETPFLHSLTENTAAIRLYESLGFRVRCAVELAVLKPI